MGGQQQDTVIVGPSGVTYRLPAGREIERIDEYLRRMKLTNVLEKLRADVDHLLEVRLAFKELVVDASS